MRAQDVSDQDVLFIRAYKKFDSGYFLSNSSITTVYRFGQISRAGQWAAGRRDRVLPRSWCKTTSKEPRVRERATPGFFHYYVYWPKAAQPIRRPLVP